MKRTYESFEELAKCMVDGGKILHVFNCAYENDKIPDKCCAWQKGVEDFAGWLDHIGIKITVTDTAQNFYDYMRTRKESK